MSSSLAISKIVVVQSLEAYETKTGYELVKFIGPLIDERQHDLKVEYRQCTSAKEFLSVVRSLITAANDFGELPVLHVECHGSKGCGLEFENGSELQWEELSAYLRELNIATRFNLVVVISACYGSYLLTKVNAISAAPFRFLVAPSEELDPAEILRGFRNFYSALLKTSDLKEAARCLAEPGLARGYWFTRSAELWFESLVAGYVQEHCTRRVAKDRARAMVVQLRSAGVRTSVDTIIQQLRERHRQDFYGKYFDLFFCPEYVHDARQRFAPVLERLSLLLLELRSSGKYII